MPARFDVAGTVGKRVRGALYVHRDAIALLSAEARAKVERAASLAAPFDWNVARVEPLIIGLLRYRHFEEAAFPPLEASARVNITSGNVRRADFSRSANPLVLHRKELLARPDHPARWRWAQVTQRAERAGLFRNPGSIGRQKAWAALLAEAGLDEQGEER